MDVRNSPVRIHLVAALILFIYSTALPNSAEAETKEPVFEDHPVSFWLDELQFVDVYKDGTEIQSGFPEIYENLDQAEAHQKKIAEIRKKAPKAIQAIGTNALPFIWPRLLTPSSSDTESFSTHQIADPATGIKKEISGRVIRGQAVEALILLEAHHSVTEPKLIEIVGDAKHQKQIRGAALYVLKKLSPENEENYQALLAK